MKFEVLLIVSLILLSLSVSKTKRVINNKNNYLNISSNFNLKPFQISAKQCQIISKLIKINFKLLI